MEGFAQLIVDTILMDQGLSLEWIRSHVSNARFNGNFTEVIYDLQVDEPLKFVKTTFFLDGGEA